MSVIIHPGVDEPFIRDKDNKFCLVHALLSFYCFLLWNTQGGVLLGRVDLGELQFSLVVSLLYLIPD